MADVLGFLDSRAHHEFDFTDGNIILESDSYKQSHPKQLPKRSRFVRSYLEPRGGPYADVITYTGLNYYAKQMQRKVEPWMIDEAEEVLALHMGPGIFDPTGWKRIVNVHGGYRPLRIRAVPEGLKIPIKNAMMTFENTDPELPWLTNFNETPLYPWYGYTVATLSNQCRQIILKALIASGTPGDIDFKLQDFGYRGATVMGQAAIGGSAHLASFKGTDTLPAIMFLRKHYGEKMAGFSIPASEHSTVTSWMRDGRRQEGETAAHRNMLYSYPTGLVACVSDSDDIYNTCEHIFGELLHDDVLKRDGVLVIRPDSGYPPEVVHKCLEILGKKFGFTVNAKGFKVLNPKVRIIQGDGVDPVMIDTVLAVMMINGWSADNVAFGMGGALLQKVNRDTMMWATKCSEIDIDGTVYPVHKQPKTDSIKKSKTGNLTLVYDHSLDWYRTVDRTMLSDGPLVSPRMKQEVMRDIYVNGETFNLDSFATIRERVAQYDLKETA